VQRTVVEHSLLKPRTLRRGAAIYLPVNWHFFISVLILSALGQKNIIPPRTFYTRAAKKPPASAAVFFDLLLFMVVLAIVF
jgi:hypothetical protein